jgi:hypothetical protein
MTVPEASISLRHEGIEIKTTLLQQFKLTPTFTQLSSLLDENSFVSCRVIVHW